MKIGLISDTHGQRTRTAQAIRLLQAAGVEAVLHAGDVGVQQAAQSQRVQEFDRMHAMVRQERHALGLHVAAGKLQLARMEAELAQLAGQEDPLSRTRRNELDHAVRLLDKRIGDLLVMQHAAEQSLPMIRMIQAVRPNRPEFAFMTGWTPL